MKFDRTDLTRFDASKLGMPLAVIFVDAFSVGTFVKGVASFALGVFGFVLAFLIPDMVWLWAGAGVLMMATGGLLTYLGLYDPKFLILEYSDGFAWIGEDRVTAVRWEEISELVFLTIDAAHWRGDPSLARLEDGTELPVGVSQWRCVALDAQGTLGSPRPNGAREFTGRICQEVSSCRLPQMLDKLAGGGAIRFGELSVSQRGFQTPKASLTWDEVKEISFAGLNAEPPRVLFARRKGDWQLCGIWVKPGPTQPPYQEFEITRTALLYSQFFRANQCDIPNLHILGRLLEAILQPERLKNLEWY